MISWREGRAVVFVTSSPAPSCSELAGQTLTGKLSLSGSDVSFHCALPPQQWAPWHAFGGSQQ